MASIIQKKRFSNEQKLLKTEPLHYITAYPDSEDPLTWYFLLIGQTETPYHGGEYIGKIVHSKKYPAEPPDYYMLTPSGRYEINKKICLSNSSYHKGEWSSTWNIKSILIAYYSIFIDDTEHGISHIRDTLQNRITMANNSKEYNSQNYSDIYNNFDLTNLHDGSSK
jgi:ubiquitin-conjugating enzyme E2 J2